MPPELVSSARQRAGGLSADPKAVEGPLSGYHHETYVFPLPEEAGGASGGRWKCREPRERLLWFDRRCFGPEEQLLSALRGRISNIPEVIHVSGLGLQRFVEGQTLGAYHASGTAVPDDLFEQILRLFRQTVAVTPGAVPVERRCEPKDRAAEGDSAGFLERLICFTEEQVYARNLADYQELFGDLGLDADSFKFLRKNVAGLRSRPFCLLHADLHRENLIVDRDRQLWAIDWELAMFGDPLYDLATHLHLMRYPADQARRMTQRWTEIVEGVRRGSSRGWREDLPKLLHYKRAQSVFTDVIRTSQALGPMPTADSGKLRKASRKVRDVLRAAARPLGLESVPGVLEVEAALKRWHGAHAADQA